MVMVGATSTISPTPSSRIPPGSDYSPLTIFFTILILECVLNGGGIAPYVSHNSTYCIVL